MFEDLYQQQLLQSMFGSYHLDHVHLGHIESASLHSQLQLGAYRPHFGYNKLALPRPTASAFAPPPAPPQKDLSSYKVSALVMVLCPANGYASPLDLHAQHGCHTAT